MKEIVTVSRKNEHLLVPIDVSKVEKTKNAKFVCETCIKDSHGNWSNRPVQIYWQENPPAGYSNYFALFERDGYVMITSGQSAVNEPITAIRHNGEIAFSRYRHDFRWVGGNTVAIDGGRDYTKIIGHPNEILTLVFDGPNLVVSE